MFTPENIREVVRANPFKPFCLHLADGKSMRVPHPDFILVSIDLVVVAKELPHGEPGELSFVPYEHIVRIELLSRKMAKAQ